MSRALDSLPDWPALMDVQTASAYVELSEVSFRHVANARGLKPVDLGLSSVRYRRRDLDAMIDSLPARGVSEAPALTASLEDLAIERALRRARR